ncbi:Hypothetical_protein [Hexamita inflata]|uniref:Hypothetical_protein n=1 Tax=Hexamita inflata TaxID=28002 RepID=A0AA86NHY7_9EUKA|nr:Hypothetical protein HINF_LOCUS6981 [Hexamita inflata]
MSCTQLQDKFKQLRLLGSFKPAVTQMSFSAKFKQLRLVKFYKGDTSEILFQDRQMYCSLVMSFKAEISLIKFDDRSNLVNQSDQDRNDKSFSQLDTVSSLSFGQLTIRSSYQMSQDIQDISYHQNDAMYGSGHIILLQNILFLQA